MNSHDLLLQANAVAIDGRALLIQGPPGSGKSTLTMELIDRGAQLIGDDGVLLSREGDTIMASPPPNIAGLMEIRGVGLARLEYVNAPVALGISLVVGAQRLPDGAETRDLMGVAIPWLPLLQAAVSLPLRAEWAMRMHGHTLP